MPVWRCPHCATPQAEASRCWVCRRSTTSCVTCRHYRRGISGGLGLCGLDPKHGPVADTDVRACWVGAPVVHEELAGAPRTIGRAAAGDHVPRTFVPVESLVAGREAAAVAVIERVSVDAPEPEPEPEPEALAPDPVPVMAPAPRDRPVPGRWWLWGDPDPWPERVGERA
jgi:hypothetical protein